MLRRKACMTAKRRGELKGLERRGEESRRKRRGRRSLRLESKGNSGCAPGSFRSGRRNLYLSGPDFEFGSLGHSTSTLFFPSLFLSNRVHPHHDNSRAVRLAIYLQNHHPSSTVD